MNKKVPKFLFGFVNQNGSWAWGTSSTFATHKVEVTNIQKINVQERPKAKKNRGKICHLVVRDSISGEVMACGTKGKNLDCNIWTQNTTCLKCQTLIRRGDYR